jgi:hypothetical protein
LTLKVLGPDGKSIAASRIAGLKGMAYWETQPPDTSRFTVVGLVPGKERTITVRHDERKLIGQITLKGDEQGPVSATLQPWGALIGRLVDSDGQSWGEAQLSLSLPGGLDLPGGIPRICKDGRFRLEGLIPGQKVGFGVFSRQSGGKGIRDLILQPGEVKDLGDLRPKVEESQ